MHVHIQAEGSARVKPAAISELGTATWSKSDPESWSETDHARPHSNAGTTEQKIKMGWNAAHMACGQRLRSTLEQKLYWRVTLAPSPVVDPPWIWPRCKKLGHFFSSR